MGKPKTYENYPCWIMFVSNLVSILIYLLGAFIIYQLGLVWLGLYVIYILFLYVRVMQKSCVNCYYYGKCCAFGTGKLSALLFKKGSPKKFMSRKITWIEILPDFLVSVIPFIVGIVLLIINFNWPILLSVILIAILTSFGNSFVRGSLACKFCRQRELGCPAEQLFSKRRK